MFLAAKHGDANDVLRNKSLGRIFAPKTPETEWFEFNYLHADSILDSEPPKHTRLRSLVAKAFNRHRIEALRPDIERLTNQLLDRIEAKDGEFDIIADYAEPLPVKVIAALLGFPDSDEHLLRPWSQAIVKMYEVNPSQAHKDEAKKAAKSGMARRSGFRRHGKAFRRLAFHMALPHQAKGCFQMPREARRIEKRRAWQSSGKLCLERRGTRSVLAKSHGQRLICRCIARDHLGQANSLQQACRNAPGKRLAHLRQHRQPSPKRITRRGMRVIGQRIEEKIRKPMPRQMLG